MKQSSIEPAKKKLKQARLPFQILSPGVKNPVATPPQQRKRKASDTAANDDVAVDKITGVKENQITPAEKKIKVLNTETDKDVFDEKESEKRSKDVEDHMEVEVEKTEAKNSSPVSTPGVKTKSTKRKTPLSSNKKSSKPGSSPRGRPKGKSTPKTDKKGSKNKNTENIKTPTIVDIVDLSDSPCKTDTKEDKSTTPTVVPKYKGTTLAEQTKEEEETDVLGNEGENKTKPQKITATEDVVKLETTQNKKIEEVKAELLPKSDDLESSKSPEKEFNQEIKKLKSNEKEKEDGVDSKCSKKDELKKSCKKSKAVPDLSSPKQPSILDMVTKKSTNTNSVSSSTDLKSEECKKINNVETCEGSPLLNETKPNSTSVTPKSDLVSHSSQSSINESSCQTPLSVNESVTSADVSPVSSCSTPASTPGGPSTAKKTFQSPLTTPRRLTPKQRIRLKEKEDKINEKNRLKEERERKKAEEKEEKEKQKQQKEEEKLKIKEEKEKKRLAEIEQKNEAKRLKDEEKKAKEEEKKAKEEEKRAKDEEKKKKEEEEKKKKDEKRLKEEMKQAEKRKSAQAFVSFFVKSEAKPAGADEVEDSTPFESNFKPFEVKNDMRLAPSVRTEWSEERMRTLDTAMDSCDQTCKLYLEEVRSPAYARGSAPKTWPAPDEEDDDVIIIESEKPNEEMEVDSQEAEKKIEKRHQRAKLLQFHENRRPPYWGTWRKKSKFVRPRAPLSQDKTMFEYDVDSDDEWEEPEDGESLRGSEDEESQDEQYEEDDDMFVPHGYLSDEEGQDELDDKSPEAMKAKLKFLQLEFEAERNEKQEKLKPRLIGCVWFCNSDREPEAVGSHIAELFLLRRAVWDGDLPVQLAPPTPASPATPTDSGDADSKGARRKLVHESMIPDIIKVVHGSRMKMSKMLKVLLDDQKEPGLRPSKKSLAEKIREIASWTRYSTETKHHCWVVKEEVRQAQGLMDLNIESSCPPPPTTPTTNITKFTKVLTSDERLKLLSPISSSKMTPTSTTKQGTPSIRLASAGKPVKKRVSLVSVPPGQSLPKKSPIMNFVQNVTKPTQCEDKLVQENCKEYTKTPSKQDTVNKKELVKVEEKVKKRVTPIMLPPVVSKAHSAPEECIVLSD